MFLECDKVKCLDAETRKKGFTLIELLVVIAIIALLLSILMPALTKVKMQARDVICRSNLHQWGLIWKMHVDDNGGKFSDGIIMGTGGWIRGEWIEDLREYWSEGGREKLLTCPSATRRLPGTTHGGPENTYQVDDTNDEDSSYGLNLWAINRYSPAAKNQGPDVQGRRNELHWGKMDVKGAARIPLFLDSMWRGGGPHYTGGASAAGIERPDYNGQWTGASYEMKHFCIDRHNKTINGVFFDLAIQKIPLKHLWKQKWHKKFDTRGYPANGGTWPGWMDSFEE